MKIEEGFILQTIGDETIVVPVGQPADAIHGVIQLNQTGAFIWNLLLNDTTMEQLTEAVSTAYAVDQSVARTDVEDFINTLVIIGCIKAID